MPAPTADSAAASLPLRWPAAWRTPDFRARLLLVLALLLGLLAALPRFFAYIQARPGVVLPDPLLAALPARDVSGLVFGTIYLSVVTGLWVLLPRPRLLLRALWAYLLLHVCRCLLLWLLPLEPPVSLVLLQDPLVDQLVYAAPAPITKDLFFSGHTATVVLLALAVGRGQLRTVLLAAAAVVGALVLVQHAHYTYDVLAAPLFAWGCYRVAGRIVA